MGDISVWFVILTVDPVTKSGYLVGTSLRVSHTGMGEYRFGWVRDDGTSRVEAARQIREGLSLEEQERCKTARVGRVTEMEEVLL